MYSFLSEKTFANAIAFSKMGHPCGTTITFCVIHVANTQRTRGCVARSVISNLEICCVANVFPPDLDRDYRDGSGRR
jgi:hypothetical protein